jgi:hypothetical protein
MSPCAEPLFTAVTTFCIINNDCSNNDLSTLLKSVDFVISYETRLENLKLTISMITLINNGYLQILCGGLIKKLARSIPRVALER